MNEDEEKIEPVTDLGPAPSYSNQYIQRLLSSGAGANAGSGLDMTFVATDPLSELVWSPQKGLSLKCADGSFSQKKSSFLWGSGPSNVFSRSRTDKPVNEEKNMTSMAAFNRKCEDSVKEILSKFVPSDAGLMPSGSGHVLTAATNGKMEERNAAEGISLLQENKHLTSNEKEAMHKTANPTMSETPESRDTSFPVDEPKLEVAQDDSTSTPTYGKPDRNLTLGMEDISVAKGKTVKEGESYNTKIPNSMSSRKVFKESRSSAERDLDNMMDSGPAGAYPMEKPESTAENDMRTVLTENVCDLAIKAAASQSAREVGSNTPQNDERLPHENAFVSKLSPTNSGIQGYETKGKAKALSDGNVNGKMWNDEDDSHESAESCNSAGQYPMGKKRWNADQQFIVESKRVKRQMQDDTPVSSLFVKKDSSFMNWISNMMKGFLKSDENEAPSLALTLANPSHGPVPESHVQDVIMSNRNQEYGSRTMGFQSIFQSLYCPGTKTQVNVSLNSIYQTEGSSEPEQGNKICALNATPIAYRTMAGNLYKRIQPTNEKLNEPISSSGESLVALPKDTSANLAASEEFNMSVFAEKKNLCHVETNKENHSASPNSSDCKQKTTDYANMISEHPSVGKTDYKSHFLGSSWITRFTQKASGRLRNDNSSNKCPSETPDFMTDGMRLNSSPQRHLDSDNHKGSETRDVSAREPTQNCATAVDSSFGFYPSKGHHDEKSGCKLNPILPSPRFKNSEAMASIFAKRLDALKHIMPSDAIDTAAYSVTCSFCGTKGHRFQDCPNLLRDLTSYNKAEDLPPVCIRCLRLNHWAIQCPNAPPRITNTSLVDDCCPSRIQINARNADVLKSNGGDSQFPDAIGPALHDGNGPGMEKSLNLNLKLNEASSPERSRLNIKLSDKDIASTSKGSKFKEPQVTPLINFLNRQTSNVPKGIFDAVKQLRLSRTDILKWMNSKTPLSHLDGFFLRLRLGKWEEGLGGTGYHVAFITGEKGESPPPKSKNPISVNVDGIKCLVESQYVSNHEFLEDEITAWWSALLKGGGKIPSEEELRLKVKEKIMLGY